MKITYEIDSMDWSDQSAHSDRDKCVQALGEWFDGLSDKTKLAIFYAQHYGELSSYEQFDPVNDGCPWIQMVSDAQTRVLKRHAPWVLGEHAPPTGYNLELSTDSVRF